MKSKTFKQFAYYLQPFLVFAVMFGISAYLSTIAVEPHHDGIMFKPAVDFAEGKILFRESFSQYGALTVILQGLAIKIFGEYLIVIRILTAFFYGLTGFLLWLVWSRILPPWLTNITCAIWILLAPEYFINYYYLPWSSVYALFFMILACYFVILSIEKDSVMFIFLSGLSSALAFWCRQPVGIFLCASLFIYVILLNRVIKKTDVKHVVINGLMFVAGVIVPSAFFFIWLISNGALHDWWLQQIYYAFVFASKADSHQSLIESVTSCLFITSIPDIPLADYMTRLTYIWVCLPIVCILLFVRIFLFWIHDNFLSRKNSLKGNEAKKIGQKEFIILALFFVSMASWMQYYPVPCARHMYWAATPMLGLFSYFVYMMFSDRTKLSGTIMTTVIIFLFYGYDISCRMMEGTEKISQRYFKLERPSVLAGMKLSEDGLKHYAEMQRVIDEYLKKYPGRGIMSLGVDGLYLTFEKNNRNFHPMFVCWEDMIRLYPDYDDKLARYIREKKPMIISNEYQYPGYRLLKTLRYVNIDTYSGAFIFVPDEK